MSSAWIFSSRVPVKSFVLPKTLLGSAKIRFPAVNVSGIRNPRIVLKRCKAQKKDEILDSMNSTKFQRFALWSGEAAYIIWLFLLPYAPGDPLWAISPATIAELIGLSLNFYFILPIMNSGGIHILESPVIHPMSEGLFNFVLGWTLLFAPLLYTDSRRDRFKGSLDLLWFFQMFLTNTFLIPYMAIRLDEKNEDDFPDKSQPVVSALTRAATLVGITGGTICVLSVYWGLLGRADGTFGGLTERLEFFWRYVSSERLAYAFMWDIFLYSIFQPWLIGDNLENLKEDYVESVKLTRFVPVLGLVFYLLGLREEKKL